MTSPARHIEELGRRLARRRAEAKLELDVLAQRAGVSRDAIERFESGATPLAAGALSRIAGVLGIPAAGLLSAEAPEETAPTAPDVLLLGGTTSWLRARDVDRLARSFERARAFAELGELLRRDTVSIEERTGPAKEVDPYREGYAAARELRLSLGLPREPLVDLSRTIEDRLGILVSRFRFDSPEIRAAAARSGRVRLIALNTQLQRVGSVRRALAHELGHHLLDLPTDGAVIDSAREADGYTHEKPAAERRADAFALMFLAPDAGVAALLGPPQRTPDLDAARALAQEVRRTFGLGFDASAYHLANLGYFADKGMAEALREAPAITHELDGFERHALPDGFERRLQAAEEASLLSAGRRRELLGRTWVDEA